MPVDEEAFSIQLQSFREQVARIGGAPFVSFREGLPFEWESYKDRIRARATSALAIDTWAENAVGTGRILDHVIAAIELSPDDTSPHNNLVSWQNRFGHANRSHCRLLDARDEPGARASLEGCFLHLFRDGAPDHERSFQALVQLAGKRYDLIAYLFFLLDPTRFMPNRPDTFDTAFRMLGTSFATKGRCSWSNYVQFNAHLEEVQHLLTAAGVQRVSLLDAHSFCWMLVRLPGELADNHGPELGAKREPRRKKDPGRRLGARERSIVAMVRSVLATVKQSTGPDIARRRKLKELTMSEAELRAYIPQLLSRQDDRCALTGIALQWHGEQDDRQLLPSLDRIDSSGNYEVGNLQVVCQFVNFWKGDSDDEEFRRLLGLVRGLPD